MKERERKRFDYKDALHVKIRVHILIYSVEESKLEGYFNAVVTEPRDFCQSWKQNRVK